MAMQPTLDLTSGDYDLKTTERGLLLSVNSEHTTYHTYIPKVRDCSVQTFGEATTTIKVGGIFYIKIPRSEWSTAGRAIMTAALGNGWEG
tara:strand:+ start:417 stop:686 length:270 start_codon:yes stop_codon:yes gene_type:complete